MRILSALVFNKQNSKPILLHATYCTSDISIFIRSNAKQIILFSSREVIGRVTDDAVSVKYENFVCHVRIGSNGLSVAIITDADYPQRIAHTMVLELIKLWDIEYTENEWQKFTKDQSTSLDGCDALIQKFQNPEETDKVLQIHKIIDETTEIMVRTMDDLLKNGENLADLMEKSQDLSAQSKIFAKQSKKMNSCHCIIL